MTLYVLYASFVCNPCRIAEFTFIRFSLCTQAPKPRHKYVYVYIHSWKYNLKLPVSVLFCTLNYVFFRCLYIQLLSGTLEIQYQSLLCYAFITYTCYIDRFYVTVLHLSLRLDKCNYGHAEPNSSFSQTLVFTYHDFVYKRGF